MKSHQRPEIVTLLVALFVLAALNVPFWRALLRAVDPASAYEWLFIGAVFASAAAAFNLVLILLPAPRTFKVIVMPLLAVTAAASYYMGEYGILIDRHMVQNIFETNTAEAGDLMSATMVVYVAALGVFPAWLLWRSPIASRPWNVDLAAKSRAALASVVVFALAVAPFYMNFTSVFREHGELKHALTPVNYISATAKYFGKNRHGALAAVATFGADARRSPAAVAAHRKSVTVIVIGETARADHFSLNGYQRETNPELSKIEGLINYPSVYSCGTDTAQSVPCMFSGMGRAKFSSDIALRQEGLLDILQRSGVSVLWRENQSGCKGTCQRVTTEIMTGQTLVPFFDNGEIHDEILLSGLEDKIAAFPADGVIVLHMMGSHGPAYYKRYLKEFERFTPACQESQFSRCTNEAIVNAYDNSILYTDHVLAKLIALLEASDKKGVAASMYFVSDHGESLGESNLYLHGMPYAIAPEVQKHVPMVVWLSENLKRDRGVDAGCLAARNRDPLSHDNLFHSVLGLAGVETNIYDKSLDIFAPCRSPAGAQAGTDAAVVR